MKLDERGKQCPMPVIEAKRALETCKAGEIVEVIVDNEIAVQNLRKMADHKGLKSTWKKVNDREFVVGIEADGPNKVGEASSEEWEKELLSCSVEPELAMWRRCSGISKPRARMPLAHSRPAR